MGGRQDMRRLVEMYCGLAKKPGTHSKARNSDACAALLSSAATDANIGGGRSRVPWEEESSFETKGGSKGRAGVGQRRMPWEEDTSSESRGAAGAGRSQMPWAEEDAPDAKSTARSEEKGTL